MKIYNAAGRYCINYYYNANIKDLCYQRHIKDIVADIIDVVEKIVYDEYQWNLTYQLFLQGYSSALIEYKFMDPTIPCCWYLYGQLKNTYSYENSILKDIATFTALKDHLH